MRPVTAPSRPRVRAAFALILLLTTVCLPALAAPAPAPATARIVFHLDDQRIDEASGIAVGIRSPDVVYVQNDSGDSARFFALDRESGRTLAVYTVPGATNVDWEDLAVARDARGVASIWLADTGDNDAVRPEVRIYRVDEPAVAAAGPATRPTRRPEVWRLRYPGGPVNVEALAVAPGGGMTLATKSPVGDTVVYSVPAAPDAKTVRTVREIGTFRVPQSDGPFGGGPLLGLLVTGAAISPDGRRFVLRTYTNAYLWSVTHGDVAAAIRARPQRIPLPEQPQGEGVAFDGPSLLIDSEHVGSAVWSVPVPPQAATTTSTTTTTTTTSTTTTSTTTTSPTRTATAATTATSSVNAVTAEPPGPRGPGKRAEIAVASLAAAAVLAALGLLLVRRRGARS